MGSIITLGIDSFEVDWGKNRYFSNHSKLFLPSDKRKEDYFYIDKRIEKKRAYSRQLRSVKRRLDLLGYTLSKTKKIFEDTKHYSESYNDKISIDFKTFANVLKTINIDKFVQCEGSEDFKRGRFISDYMFNHPEFNKLFDMTLESRFDGIFFEELDPYIILRLLAENPSALNKNLIWRYADIVDGGYIHEREIYEPLRANDKYLIITEGSTDSSILKKSLPLVASDISDFFYFIDMNEGYPFTGTGNILQFCKGLQKIQVQNKTLIVVDNDSAGIDIYNKITKLKLPSNIKIAVLPDIIEGNSFYTIGPTGEEYSNINGKAVSIELFLDLNYKMESQPVVRWTSYKDSLKRYQGELVNKYSYTRLFLSQKKTPKGYKLDKLKMLWDSIYKACILD